MDFAQTICARCGSFTRREEARLLGTQLFCPACSERPEVNYLEAFRLERWGRRSTWVWLVGLGGFANLVAGLLAIFGALAGLTPDAKSSDAMVGGLAFVVSGAVNVGFFFGVKSMRWAFLIFGLISAVLVALVNPQAVLMSIIIALVALAIFRDVPTRLFFKHPVSEKELQRTWNIYKNNPIARAAMLVGILSLLGWPFGVIAILLGVIGLKRVNPTGMPPQGRKGSAITGIVLGSLSTIALVVVVIAAVMEATS